MSGEPFVSLVIPTHDGRRFLETLLPSIEAQKDPRFPFEVIVVDNASRDGTADLLRRRHPAVRVHVNATNEGFAAPCNRGAELARGRWVGFLNNDMALEPGWLTAMGERSARGDADAVSGKLLSMDARRVIFAGGGLNYYGAGYQAGHGEPVESVPDEHEDLLFGCGASLWVRRDVFLDAGGFDPDYFAYYEDVDLGWRLRLYGRRIVYEPKAVARHLHQGTSARSARSKIFYHCERNMLFTLIKNLGEESLYRVLAAAFLLQNRRAMMGFPLPVPSFAFAEEPSAPRPRPDRSPAALWRKGIGLLRQPFSTPYGESLSRLRAMDDVLSCSERLWKKRGAVQARRRIPDAEIFPLFRRPLYTPWADERYARSQERMYELLGINRLFPPGANGR